MRQVAALVPAFEIFGFGVVGSGFTPLLLASDEAAEVFAFRMGRLFHGSAEHCSARSN